jgi:HSP20 family protein
MELTPWNPWEEMEKLRAEMDHMWERFLGKLHHEEPEQPPISFLPSVDFVETREDYRLFLSVPGLIEQDIDLSIEDRVLTVRGERHPPYDPQHHQARLREWRYGYFKRRITLPGPIEATTLNASYEAGVLTIVVAKEK